MTDSAALLFAAFSLRLALGLIGSLYLLPTRGSDTSLSLLPDNEVPPRFYRTHFLIVLGLLTISCLLLWTQSEWSGRAVLLIAAALCYVGSIVWNIEGAPGGLLVIMLLTGPLIFLSCVVSAKHDILALAEIASSAAVLGLALSAMLMGHSYLIAPAMSITPLMRLLIGLFVAVALRMVVSGLSFWTLEQPLASLPVEAAIWLALRWGVGFGGTLVLGRLAWRCARIRSTQSATGILYVVVIFAFIGELISQILRQAGYPG